MLKNLRKLLADKGMTQKELAKKTNMSIATISNYVAGKGNPTFTSIYAICEAIGCEMDELVGQKYTIHIDPESGQSSRYSSDRRDPPAAISNGGEGLMITFEQDLFVIKAYRRLVAIDKEKVDALLFKSLMATADSSEPEKLETCQLADSVLKDTNDAQDKLTPERKDLSVIPRQQLRRFLTLALELLPKKEQLAVAVYYFEGDGEDKDVAALARYMSTNEEGVRQLLKKAVSRLRNIVDVAFESESTYK